MNEDPIPFDPDAEHPMRKLILDMAYAIRRPDAVKPGRNRGDCEFIWLDERFVIETTEEEPDWLSRPDWSRSPPAPPADGLLDPDG